MEASNFCRLCLPHPACSIPTPAHPSQLQPSSSRCGAVLHQFISTPPLSCPSTSTCSEPRLLEPSPAHPVQPVFSSVCTSPIKQSLPFTLATPFATYRQYLLFSVIPQDGFPILNQLMTYPFVLLKTNGRGNNRRTTCLGYVVVVIILDHDPFILFFSI